jgi:hypothetical protein
VIEARLYQFAAKIMCRKINATTVMSDASGRPALTESMIIEGRSDLNMTGRVIPKPRSDKPTLKASVGGKFSIALFIDFAVSGLGARQQAWLLTRTRCHLA